MEFLDLATKTLFADFQESVLFRFRLEQDRSRQKIFVRKRVKTNEYWYTEINTGAQKNKQAYFGPVTPENNRIAGESREKLQNQTEQILDLILLERKKISLLKKAGFPDIDRKTAKILDHFSKKHISYQNGVLVGSLALYSYPGILGVVFDHGGLKTDIDVARTENERVTLTTTEELFQDFSQDVRAIPGLKHLALPSSFIFQDEVKIDFLIPRKGKERKTYKFPGIVGLGAEALRFLDYLIEERVQGILLSQNKAIPVTVPHPARFALHKILVGMKRGPHESTKRSKDFHQASQLIVTCAQEMPEFLQDSLAELVSRGKKWKALLNSGKKHLSPPAQSFLDKVKM